MQIKTELIREDGCGDFIGKEVWICHYNQPDMNNKPIRSVPPTKVIIRSTDDLPKNKKVYYSHNYFSPIGKNGKPLSKVISPVDNTGYRMRCGNELFVFDNEFDCTVEWNKQLRFHAEKLDPIIEIAKQALVNQKKNIIDKMIYAK